MGQPRGAAKIKQVDDVIAPLCQKWVYEVHPEVCFWALAGKRPMVHGKKTKAGVVERLALLRSVFPKIEHHLHNRLANVGKDDLLDAAVAAWTATRLWKGEAHQVCKPERDANGSIFEPHSGDLIISHALLVINLWLFRSYGAEYFANFQPRESSTQSRSLARSGSHGCEACKHFGTSLR